jgi:5-carboxymethyl-2-hydroxymuconate isomerase
MPHLVILYTPNLDHPPEQGGCDMTALCRALADTMIAQRDDADKPVFPKGGVRVLAYPAAHFAVADGGEHGGPAGQAAGYSGAHAGYAFVYLNLRMGRGRSSSVHARVGAALEACVKVHLADQLARRPIGLTLQIDEGPEVFDAKNSSLHPLFNKLT